MKTQIDRSPHPYTTNKASDVRTPPKRARPKDGRVTYDRCSKLTASRPHRAALSALFAAASVALLRFGW